MKCFSPLAVIVVMLIAVGCYRDKTHSHTSLSMMHLHTLLQPAHRASDTTVFTTFPIPTIMPDTLFRNLPYSFSEAENLIQQHFAQVDLFPIPETSKQYSKALLVADFVYAAFSYRFLGDSLGINNDSLSDANWNKLSIEERYNLGVYNHKAVYCEGRAQFYADCVRHWLKLHTQMVSKPGVHTFPLTAIDGEWYLIDPYDPFVVADSLNDLLLNYEACCNSKSAVRIFRSKHVFGNSRELISIPLLMQQDSLARIENVVSYTQQIADTFRAAYGTVALSKMRLPNFYRAQPMPIANRRFGYSLALSYRPDKKDLDIAYLQQFYCF